MEEKCFTTKYLFVTNKLRYLPVYCESIHRQTYQARLRGARNEFNTLSINEKEMWEIRKKQHLHQWAVITNTLVRELRDDNSISYQKLAAKLNYWCSEGTTQTWVQSRNKLYLYIERFVPLLSDVQPKKHLECVQRIVSN